MKKLAAWFTPERANAALRTIRRVGVLSMSFSSREVSILGVSQTRKTIATTSKVRVRRRL